MEDYKKVTRYWRNSLVDKRFGQGKFKKEEVEQKFTLNPSSFNHFIESKTILQGLLPGFVNPLTTACYIPMAYSKRLSHLQREFDMYPDLFFPVCIKVELSPYGFIYPCQTPIIPRDLLYPLDTEDFYIGKLKHYDLFITKHEAPVFSFQEDYPWEEYYRKEIEPVYLQGLIDSLIQDKLIKSTQEKKDKVSLLQGLYTSKNKEFLKHLASYNSYWDSKVSSFLQDNELFVKQLENYHKKWEDYFDYVDNLLKDVVKDTEVLKSFEAVYFTAFASNHLDVSGSIVNVYDDVYKRKVNKNELLVYKNYADLKTAKEKPLEDSREFFLKRLGHNNNEFALAKAQRDAVSSLEAISTGEVLPVNGPPGTGKTTMVLSVVASLWVSKALEQGEPPLIVASSTNNQAVTNIIDAFSKDFSKADGILYSRWLKGVNTFGSYFASSSNTFIAKNKGYMLGDDFKSFESEGYFKEALPIYLAKAAEFLNQGNLSLTKTRDALLDLLKTKYDVLKNIESAFAKYDQSKDKLSDLLQVESSELTKNIDQIEKSLSEELQALIDIEDLWQVFLAEESLLDSSLSFVSVLAKKRNAKAILYAKKHDFGRYFDLKKFDVATFDKVVSQRSNDICYKTQQIVSFKKVEKKLQEVLDSLDLDLQENITFDKVDQKMDTSIRFEMFWIASHYWEARWLLDMQQLIDDNQIASVSYSFEKFRKQAWHRRMKITPCAVMTSYMLPYHLSYSRKLQDNVTKTDYLYDFIDLLIIDEAGQVSPEVGGASFAFAKKALVIGDTLQIPPISSLTKSVDIGNLQDVNLLDSALNTAEIEEKYLELQTKGLTTVKGSVMRISQQKTAYIPQKKLQRGLYLYEHRRCYNEIIDYCNELCYHGVLQPKRPNSSKESFIPVMGYLHIEGKCELQNASRVNFLEAKLIAGWIISNYALLLKQYPGREIKDIIAVVTPFKEQSIAISEFFKSARDKSLIEHLNKITVGTVHSLQGAERNVVIFSPTYSCHQKGNFINNDPSMLNVAVSRAKDSFLVFGDMSLFNPVDNTPCGILSKYLYAKQSNKLMYKYQYSSSFVREDLDIATSTVQTLTDHMEHDAFLKEALQSASKRVIIVSPWIIYDTIESNNYLDLLKDSNLQITIYTDRRFNTFLNNKFSPKKQQDFEQAIVKLQDLGVEVIVGENIHSKVVVKDQDCICVGSFNWFSAQRKGNFKNREHSLVYSGDCVKQEIDKVLGQLV